MTALAFRCRHLVLASPALAEPTRGNARTVDRYLAIARQAAERASVVGGAEDAEALVDAPCLVHAHHAWHGRHGLALARRYGCPLVLSLGGSEADSLIAGDERAAVIEELLEAADLVVGAFRDPNAPHPRMASGLHLVPRSIDLPELPDQAEAALEARDPSAPLRILLPAGLRPIKDIFLALRLHEALRAAGVHHHLRILGAPLEASYAERVGARVAGDPEVSLSEVAPSAMPSEYLAADCVWNTSRSEGGANALLEALAFGVPILARAVPGNARLFERAPAPARLFSAGHLDLAVAWHQQLAQRSQEERVADAARLRHWVGESFRLEAEAAALRAAWATAVAGLSA